MPDAETVELRIERVGVRGDGIAQWHGEPVFVPFTAPGDVVGAVLGPKRGEGRVGALRELIATGARAQPPCAHFGECGGCALQHLDQTAYVAAKRQWLDTALAQHGLKPDAIAPLTRFPAHTRRRARFQLAGRRVGFHARASHRIVDLRECHVLHPQLVALVPALRSLAAITGASAASATLADNGVDLLLDLPRVPDLAQLEAMARVAEAVDLARLSWRHDDRVTPVAEHRKPVVHLSGVPVVLPEDAFLQASAAAEAALVAVVGALAGPAQHIADLYAGIGTFSFALTGRAKVHAVEAQPGAVAALSQAASRAGLAKFSAERRDLAARPLGADELAAYDAVVFDPPYAGAAAQCRALAHSAVPRLVAVSCNPASFARDARILVDGGYRLTTITPFDAFLWSANLELVAGFERS
ncbi:MAG TPA: RsmD family RNA methyltransferase [Stellaceae bacterium]|jgi:23S rRNA (uracil1939-C5)-methyltransferase|nr:RsmD family RNA methyltransferase [Stellaceae bacterium]